MSFLMFTSPSCLSKIPERYIKRYDESKKPATGDLVWDFAEIEIKTEISGDYVRMDFCYSDNGKPVGLIFKDLKNGTTFIRNYDGWYIDEDSDGRADAFISYKSLCKFNKSENSIDLDKANIKPTGTELDLNG